MAEVPCKEKAGPVVGTIVGLFGRLGRPEKLDIT